MPTLLALRAERRRLRAAALQAVGAALQTPGGDDGEDLPSWWAPAPDVEVTLALEADPGVLRVTRISAEPMGAGWGRIVVDALRAHCQDHGLTLEIPDPFPQSLVFWHQWTWQQVGGDDRIVLRHTPTR